jgi:hypothetical protein
MIHRYYPSVKILHALIIAIVMMLSACGGGGGGDTSSGGGSAADYAGTYNGSMTATLSTPGQPSQTISGIMQITVDAAGTVNVLLSPPDVWGTGTLSGDNFTITSPFAFNEDGIACDGPATITGEIKNDQINGTFKGTINCTTQGITIPFTIDGTYTVVKAAGAAAAIAGGFMQSVISAIQNVMK